VEAAFRRWPRTLNRFGDTLKGFRLARASALLRWVMENNKTEVET